VRRLIACWLLALGVLAAPADAARLRITSPLPGAAVAVHPHVEDVAAQLEVRGRAHPGAYVEARARCVLGPCVAAAVADRKGRWTARLTVIRDAWRRTVTVTAASPSHPDGEILATYPVRLPPWASLAPYAGSAPAPRLAMIGDSLAVGTDGLLRTDLPGWRVTTDGRVGRPLAEGMALLAATRLPEEPLALAFSLFTNNDPRQVDALEASVRASVTRLPPRGCAIWSTIVRPKVGGVTYEAVNQRLKRLRRDPALRSQLLVVDWARAVGRHPEWLREDGIHPTPEGYARRARLYAYAAEACRAGRRW
jgi:hypothetical protein